MPNISALVITIFLNTKIGEVENKIPNVSGLVTTTIFNAKIVKVLNKIPDVSGLVKKTNNNAETSDTGTKYFTTSDYNTFTMKILGTKIKKNGLAGKSIIAKFLIL